MKAYDGDKPYIFVSYSHADSVIVEKYIAALMAKGYRIWFDEGIKSGVQWANYIADKIQNATFFLTFFSETAINSENVKDEVNEAKKDRLPMCILYLEDCKPESGIEMFIGRWQNINFDPKRSFAESLERIVAGLPMETKEEAETIKTDDAGVKEFPKSENDSKTSSKKLPLWYIILPIACVLLLIVSIVVFAVTGKRNSGTKTDTGNSSVSESVTAVSASKELNTDLENTESSVDGETETISSEVLTPTSVEYDRVFKAYYYPITYEEAGSQTDNPEDMIFEVGGATYKLGTPLSLFLDNGWVIATSGYFDDIEIDSEGDIAVELAKNSEKFNISVANMDHKPTALKDCITYKAVLKSNDLSYSLAGNITGSSTEEEVDAVYKVTENNGNHYTADGYYYFRFYDTSNLATLYRNLDFKEYITIPFSMEGVEYELPCKLTDFLDNGWTLYSTHSDTLEPRTLESVKIVSQGKEMTLSVGNINTNPIPFDDAYVYKIELTGTNQGDFSIATGLNASSSFDDIKAALGEPSTANEGSVLGKYTYYYLDTYSIISVSFTKTYLNGEHGTITLSNETKPWDK